MSLAANVISKMNENIVSNNGWVRTRLFLVTSGVDRFASS